MINNNKILTVSYGTFSCTLEGFDDSFGTMKAIAEYFRDLSAGDRYFGAEPAQPDAQMLAHIAQQEISRHVDAREDDGKIVLSARVDAAQSPPAAAPATLMAGTAAAVADTADANTDEGSVNANAAEADMSSSVEMDGVDPAEDDQPEDDLSKDAPDAPHQEADGVVDIVPGQPDVEVEAFFADSPKEDLPTNGAEMEPVSDAAPATPRPAPENIADKLQRIRAVVSQHSEDDDDLDYSEDQHAESDAPADSVEEAAFGTQADADAAPASDDADAIMQDTLRDIEEALDADDATQTPPELHVSVDDDAEDDGAEGDAAEDDDDDISAILDRLGRAETDHNISTTPTETPPTATDDQPALTDLDDDVMSGIQDTLAADAEDAVDNLFGGEDDTDGGDAEAATEDFAEEDAEDFAEAASAPEPKAPSPAPIRVVKVKRVDLEAAIENGALEEYDDDEDAAESASSLSDDDEAELARELAEVAAELEDGADDEIPAAEKSAARRSLPEIDDDETQEGDMSRLMAKTDSQMGDAESAGRREAFTHLRAAVAAKEADVAMGADTGEPDEGGAYREDLASVVRPRRPVAGAGAGRSARPGDGRPAPLKLVAEQRVDAKAPSSDGPVRPRRVAATRPDATPEASEGGFVEFAEEMGAVKLPDLLEAAAAYMSYVEGREQFSRPQLMTKVRQVEQENFSREDGLRWFGKLLREGKIEKLQGGRFQVSDQIGFKPDARAAG